MRGALFAISILLVNLFSVNSQGTDHTVSCDFEELPFPEFAEWLDESCGLKCFYLDEWTARVRITAKGEQLSLSSILEENLKEHELSFYMDRSNNVFILDRPIVTLEELTREQEESTAPAASTQAGSKEEQYFGGRREEVTESVSFGKKNGMSGRSQVTLYGKISDAESGESLIGATVFVGETKTGAVSDLDGRYQLVTAPGEYNLSVNSLGMREIKYKLSIYEDGKLDINMDKEIIPINEVTIQTEKHQNVSGIQMGFTKLDIKTIKEIPLVMGEKDLLKVAQMLPGIQTVGEGSSGFNVRGSSADQNMFYINKVPVYNTSHLFGFFSAFSPDIVKDFSLYKSNVPVEYGGRIASIFNISTREGNKNRFTGRGGISPVTGHIALEGPIVKEKHSFVVSARSTYSDYILRLLEDPDLRKSSASFYDFSAGVTLEPDNKNLFRLFSYHTSDRFNYADYLSYNYQNSGASASWRRRISPALSSDLAAVSGNYSFGTTNQEVPSNGYRHDYRIGHHEIKSDFRWVPFPKHIISFGGSMIYYRLDRGTVGPYGDESFRKTEHLGFDNGIESALYIGDKYELARGITLYGGIRYTLFNSFGPKTVYDYLPGASMTRDNRVDSTDYAKGQLVKTYSGPDLRMAVNFRTSPNSSVKVSYNRIRQYLFLLSNTVAIAPTDQWKLVDYHIRPPWSDQVSAGFYKDFPATGIHSSAEIYYKKVKDVVEYKDGADFTGTMNVEEDILQGNQDAYGLELMLEKKKGRLNGWISYTWSRSQLVVDGDDLWDRINSGLAYPANYDRPHSLNLIMNYRVNRRLSFSGNLVYTSGRPVTYPVSVYRLNGQEIINYSERNAYRLPDYFRMDLSMNLEGNLKRRKNLHSFWMVNIYNLTGRKNAYSVYFRSEEGTINGYKISIFGSTIVSLSWNFKFGNYASE